MNNTIGNLSFSGWLVTFIVLTVLVWLIARQRYCLSRDGRKVLKRLKSIWIRLAATVAAIIGVATFYADNQSQISDMVRSYVAQTNGKIDFDTMRILILFLIGIIMGIWFIAIASFAASSKKNSLMEMIRQHS